MYFYTGLTKTDTMLSKKLKLIVSFAALLLVAANTNVLAQTVDEKVSTLEGKVDGVADRTTELENTVSNLAKLKISGYVQPQWNWQDVDSLGNQLNSRNAFSIRRGRVKFVHKSGDIGATIYPDITENGVILKEVFANWDITKQLTVYMGSMNRPFGYEIAYSSSSREVTERSLAEQRLFNGERDLGLQLTYNPTIGGIKPTIELGLFNGSDNFGAGPVGGLFGSNNKLGFTGDPAGTVIGSNTYSSPISGADSAFKVSVNAAVGKESVLSLNTGTGVAIGQPAKELIGHFRVPFLVSDEFSFDIGASISLGGITEPSDIVAKYDGTNGALQLHKAESPKAGHSFNNQNNTFLQTNRSIIGVDGQFYLSILPFGGTILKGELYTGQMPFYGSAYLFTTADVATHGAPVASTVYKKMLGFYGMLVQNLMDNLQIAVRYESFDPNTQVAGTNFAFLDGAGKAQTLLGTRAKSQFGGDLKVSTFTFDINVFVSGSMRLMFDYDMVKTEEYTKVSGATAIATQPDAKDDRFTFRMQYKF